MSADDFFAPAPARVAQPAPPPGLPGAPAPPAAGSPAARPSPPGLRWLVIGVAFAVLAAAVGLGIGLWRGSSAKTRPDPATARVFGQQTRLQLPQPVTPDECTSAVHAFPAIARDARASAAFVAGCEQGG